MFNQELFRIKHSYNLAKAAGVEETFLTMNPHRFSTSSFGNPKEQLQQEILSHISISVDAEDVIKEIKELDAVIRKMGQ